MVLNFSHVYVSEIYLFIYFEQKMFIVILIFMLFLTLLCIETHSDLKSTHQIKLDVDHLRRQTRSTADPSPPSMHTIEDMDTPRNSPCVARYPCYQFGTPIHR
eukprot:gb/GECH01003918.1/.p1 GENE.gb/GECH01003918.1/~~gb/GECH01003918.1/.p1  ORF type:complete len:103 (+),score=6.09 gb/GECH01003918.1/:1-309(+)